MVILLGRIRINKILFKVGSGYTWRSTGFATPSFQAIMGVYEGTFAFMFEVKGNLEIMRTLLYVQEVFLYNKLIYKLG